MCVCVCVCSSGEMRTPSYLLCTPDRPVDLSVISFCCSSRAVPGPVYPKNATKVVAGEEVSHVYLFFGLLSKKRNEIGLNG